MNFLLVLGCRGQGSHKPSDRGDCALRLEGQGPLPGMGAETLCAVPGCCVSVPGLQDDEQVRGCLENKLCQSTMHNMH